MHDIALWAVIGVAILGLGVALAALRRTGGQHPALPYRVVPSLLTPAERRFYAALVTAIDPHMTICAKVRLADVLTLPPGTPEWRAHFNRVQAKHLDFVLCNRDDLAPLLAIELDDSSHARSARRERDAFLNQACADAGLSVLRIPVQRSYTTVELAQRVQDSLNRPSAA